MARRAALVAIALLLGVVPATGGEGGPVTPDPPAAAADTTRAGLHLSALLEKTIFQVDVARLELRLGPPTAAQLRQLGRRHAPDRAPADSLAALVAGCREARAELTLVRDVGLGRFLEGVIADMARARDAGLLSRAGFREVAAGLPRWLAPLRAGGLAAGDRFLYTVAGDTLRTVYRRRDGTVVIDQTDQGPEHRRALLGGFVAPGAAFAGALRDRIRAATGQP
jgi:hypothetical protein